MADKALRSLIESGRLKRFLDPRLVQAIKHPFREHLLAEFNEGITSATEIAGRLGLEVPDFYKHIQVLEGVGCIEEVEVERAAKRPGAKERFFEAKTTIELNDFEWKRVPATMRSDMTASYFQSIWDDGARAVHAGVFAAEETHVTWLPGRFDRVGWREAMAILDEVLVRLSKVQKQSTERVARSGQSEIAGTIAVLGFETPQ